MGVCPLLVDSGPALPRAWCAQWPWEMAWRMGAPCQPSVLLRLAPCGLDSPMDGAPSPLSAAPASPGPHLVRISLNEGPASKERCA